MLEITFMTILLLLELLRKWLTANTRQSVKSAHRLKFASTVTTLKQKGQTNQRQNSNQAPNYSPKNLQVFKN